MMTTTIVPFNLVWKFNIPCHFFEFVSLKSQMNSWTTNQSNKNCVLISFLALYGNSLNSGNENQSLVFYVDPKRHDESLVSARQSKKLLAIKKDIKHIWSIAKNTRRSFALLSHFEKLFFLLDFASHQQTWVEIRETSTMTTKKRFK